MHKNFPIYENGTGFPLFHTNEWFPITVKFSRYGYGYGLLLLDYTIFSADQVFERFFMGELFIAELFFPTAVMFKYPDERKSTSYD